MYVIHSHCGEKDYNNNNNIIIINNNNNDNSNHDNNDNNNNHITITNISEQGRSQET